MKYILLLATLLGVASAGTRWPALDNPAAVMGTSTLLTSAAISGAIMLGAAVIDSVTYAADTSAMYIWTRGKKGTVTLTAP
jgi:hypothetical protein